MVNKRNSSKAVTTKDTSEANSSSSETDMLKFKKLREFSMEKKKDLGQDSFQSLFNTIIEKLNYDIKDP